jgi:hypothetical protein
MEFEMGKINNSAAGYRPKSTHQSVGISPKNGPSDTVGFRMKKNEFRKFCIDGLALCEDEEVGQDIYVTAHCKNGSVTTIGRRLHPEKTMSS